MMMTGRDQSQNIRPTVNTVQCRMNQKIVINIVIFCLLGNQSVQSIMNKRNTEAGINK